MRLTLLFSFTLFLCALRVQAIGLSCTDHPLYKRGRTTSVLIRSWVFRQIRPRHMYFTESMYLPRWTRHVYAPSSSRSSKKYYGHDLFLTRFPLSGRHDFLRMEFQRRATVTILVTATSKRKPRLYLPGWRSVGWVEVVRGRGRAQFLKYGLARKETKFLPTFAYAFSRSASHVAILPDQLWVKRYIRGARGVTNLAGGYVVIVSEANGGRPRAPKIYGVPEARPLTWCPKRLHDSWTATSTDPAERGVKFKTWHPAYDPCIWCAYNHEHGSSPKHIMGYEPKYGYLARKNNRENESHEGFKGFVFRVGRYYVYYGIHAHLSTQRRFTARFHTVVLAVTDSKTKRLLVELGFKGDFGFAAARKRGGNYVPLSKYDVVMDRKACRRCPRFMRMVNVINPYRLDRLFSYRSSDMLHGQYGK